MLLWNSVPRDWEDPLGWVETALADVIAQDHTVLVLHDLPTGAMDRLPEFLDKVEQLGVKVTNDVPEDWRFDAFWGRNFSHENSPNRTT